MYNRLDVYNMTTTKIFLPFSTSSREVNIHDRCALHRRHSTPLGHALAADNAG